MGIFWGYLALVDKTYMENEASPAKAEASVSSNWWGYMTANSERGVDYEVYTQEWARNWQTFWAVLITSTVLAVAWNVVKCSETTLTKDKLLQAILLTVVLEAVQLLNVDFGILGLNPALAAAYVSFTKSQSYYPNVPLIVDKVVVGHYLWVYLTVPFVGAILGGFLFKMHRGVQERVGERLI